MVQQLDEKAERTLRISQSDVTADMTIPDRDTRKGKYLAFNATTGLPEAGASSDDVATLAAITSDIATLADIEDGTDATDAIQTVAGISSNVTTVAGISSNVTTVAGISSNVTAVAGDATDIGAVAALATEIGRLGTADAVADMAILGTADVVADMNTLATSAIVTDLDALANLTTEIDALGDITSNITTVSGIASNVTTVAGISANVTTVAGVSSDVTTVAGISSDVAAVENIAANVTTVAGNSANVTTVAGINSDVTTLAGISTDVTSLANAIGVATTYAVTVSGGVFYIDGASNPALTLTRGNTYIFDQSDSSNAGHPLAFRDSSDNSYTTGVTVTGTAGQAGAKVTFDVASNAPSSLKYYCTTHGNSMGNSITVVNSNLATVASNITSVNTVAGANSNISTVAGAITNVNTTATNIAGVNSFAERYRVGSTDPTTDLDAGDLFYNTTSNLLKRYNGSAWISISSGLTSVAGDSSPALGGNLDVNGNSIVSTSNADITIEPNGTGDVNLTADTVQVGSNNENATVTTQGTGDLTINTNNGTNSGSIVIADGANGDISITPNGSGKVILDGLSHPTADGSAGQFLKTDGSGNLSFGTVASDLVADTSPQLGGTLDTNGQAIQFGSSKWTIELDGNNLLFKYNGTAKIKFASDGEIVTVDDVTAFGSI